MKADRQVHARSRSLASGLARAAAIMALAGASWPALALQPEQTPGNAPKPGEQPPIQPPAAPGTQPGAQPGNQPQKPPETKPAEGQPKDAPKAEPKPETPPAEKPAEQPADKPTEKPADKAADPTKSKAVDEVAKQQDAASKDAAPIAPRRNNPPVNARPAPVRPAMPAPKIGVDDIGVPTGGRYGEGKFLLRRTGTLIKAPTGEWVISFNKSTTSKRERPAILLPNSKLTQLEAQLGANSATASEPTDKPVAYPDTLVTITGEVFNYLGREYILVSLFSVAPNTPEAAETSAAQPAKNAKPQSKTEPQAEPKAEAKVEHKTASAVEAADPSVDDLIKDLQQRRGMSEARPLAPTAPPVAKKTPPAEPVVAPPPRGLVAEGTVLSSKRGRIVRLRGGELAFSIDNDAASQSQPFVLLPCKTLERLEQLFWSRGDNTVVELSGRSTIYQGRNYVLPTSFILPVPSELRPMQ